MRGSDTQDDEQMTEDEFEKKIKEVAEQNFELDTDGNEESDGGFSVDGEAVDPFSDDEDG